ncbi:UNVERIFIED_CONTAM: Proline-rich receptor-like protein kinase PERK1 [Sesamum calycinum]|uniref:non-specific serine/threonine protein kinase n=1 Tax=Sesamum calycinum TaxID=2727403 RepID=A0AAW2N4S6_9LAMI
MRQSRNKFTCLILQEGFPRCRRRRREPHLLPLHLHLTPPLPTRRRGLPPAACTSDISPTGEPHSPSHFPASRILSASPSSCHSPSSTPPPPSSTPPPTTAPPSPPSSTPPSGSPVTPSPPAPTGGGSPPAPSGSSSPPAPSGGSSPQTPSGRGSPPTGRGSPPAPTGTGGSPPSSSGGSSGVSTGLVVGIAVGGVVILAILSLLLFAARRRREDHSRITTSLHPHHLDTKKVIDFTSCFSRWMCFLFSDPYGGPVQHWQHNAPPPGDHVVTIPPKPSPPPGGASRPPHSPVRAPSPQPPPPPPPPAYISSSGGSGSNYSGSGTPLPPPSPGMALGFSKSTFTYEELAMATDGFSDANLLGQGGFGYVHRGVLPNGKEVAVKQLKAGSGQGEREFQAEVEIISRVHHKHLVSLVGYCSTGTQRMLVYEFVPNNTLEFHLHGNGRPVMDWPTRLRIALGAAKGLAYLHEDCHPKIIHRDIKAANILLDFNFEAKVADFGLAKFSSDANTHVYKSDGNFRARPVLTRALEDGNFDALVDQRLRNDHSHNEMARMVACAAACVRHSARRRPRMSQVVRALEGDVSLSDLNEGIRPGHSTVYSSHGSSDYDTFQYNEDMKKFRKMALGSQEYGSSGQYSNPTSEYGLNPSGSSSEGQQQSREMEMSRRTKDSRGFSSEGQQQSSGSVYKF